ncbi:hypothetical protein FJZ41_03530 [Candidatus Shapirobacteria bacterium]|nr:hypothetical protein [Candidatus Shapirobacteria bacterium]
MESSLSSVDREQLQGLVDNVSKDTPIFILQRLLKGCERFGLESEGDDLRKKITNAKAYREEGEKKLKKEVEEGKIFPGQSVKCSKCFYRCSNLTVIDYSGGFIELDFCRARSEYDSPINALFIEAL